MRQKIREIRKEKGISQTFMAKKLGYKTSGGYANMENGKCRVTVEKAALIAELFSMDVKDIFFK